MKTIELFEGQTKCQDVLKEVLNERRMQEQKWGQQNHDGPFYLTILMEEVGECAEAILESRADPKSWEDRTIRNEAIQIAAVAIAMVEAFDRGAVR